MASKPDEDFEIDVETDDDTPESRTNAPDIEIEDDTPEADRNREPMPKDIVDELEADELEEYSDKVKTRLKQMKKVWHDERREKERVLREQQEVLAAAQRMFEENNRLKSTLSDGENYLLSSYRNAAEIETREAERTYREAYESGDSDRMVEAQRKLTDVALRKQQIDNYQPTLQVPTNTVQNYQEPMRIPQPDASTMAWQERNQWYGTDAEMTASALGLHQKLLNERGPQFAGSDEYWQTIDKTMSRRFPEYFGDEVADGNSPVARPKTTTVVASASRSRSPKKIRLTTTQLAVAKKFGLTPEQYAREVVKMEN
jgi:hypothetical protein